MPMIEKLEDWSDEDLVSSLEALVSDERQDLIRILKHLAELERRRLAVKKGYPSLYAYCTTRLRFSEAEAMRRIYATRAAARFPVIYKLIERGRLTLTAVALLEPHLTRANYHKTLKRAVGLPKRDLERLVAEFAPMAPAPERIRHLGVVAAPPHLVPAASLGIPTSVPCLPSPDFFVTPETGPSKNALSPQSGFPAPVLVEFKFSADEAFLAAVERAKALLRHRHPAGRLKDIFTDAVEALLENVDPERRLARKASRHINNGDEARDSNPIATGGRAIPRHVKDAVWLRDEGECAFKGCDGLRCGSRDFLEFDHVVPWALGGSSDNADNIRLLCRAHNQEEARRVFGDDRVDSAIEGRRTPPS